MENLLKTIREFRDERGWRKYHNPKDLAISICIEASELLEIFQWESDPYKVCEEKSEQVREELADVMIYCLFLADVLGINPEEAITEKIEKNRRKYPVK